MCNNKHKDCGCIAEILTIINILQKNAECPDGCLDSCDRGFLGSNQCNPSCNTRPVSLYTACGNGEPWRAPIEKVPNGQSEYSTVFRVEKIDDCCATFRVLAPNPNPEEVAFRPYVATNSFFTMDLSCCCAVRCLPDTIVDCL